MASGRFDLEDVPPWVAFSFAAAASAGLAKLTLSTNFQLTDVAFTWQGTSFDFALLTMLAAIGVVSATNEIGSGDLKAMLAGEDPRGRGTLDQWEHLAVVGLVALVILTNFVPGVESWITGSDIAGFAVVIIQTAGLGVIAYGG